VLGGFVLLRIHFCGIFHGENFLLPELGIVIKTNLGVDGHHLLVISLHQGVDLQLQGVDLQEQLPQLFDFTSSLIN
jgi:hypothetical protein